MYTGLYQSSDWCRVADELARRLESTGAGGRKPRDGEAESAVDYVRAFQRDRLVDWLVDALERAGRSSQVLAILEREATITGSYERLVKRLVEHKRWDDARRWAIEGIARTANKHPGIAMNLVGRLCEIAKSQKQWDIVAAHAAQDFFVRPSREGFSELLAAAKKAGEEVAAALRPAFTIPPACIVPSVMKRYTTAIESRVTPHQEEPHVGMLR